MKSTSVKRKLVFCGMAAFLFIVAGPWEAAFGAVLESKLTPTIVKAGQLFGNSVSISGDTAVIGSPRMNAHDTPDQTDIGYVFVRSAGTWTAQGRLALLLSTPSGDNCSSCHLVHDYLPPWFLKDVDFQFAVSGNTVIAAGRVSHVSRYEVRIFERSGETWTEKQAMQASNGAVDSTSPIPVAVDGDTIALGTTAVADVYVRSGGTWMLQQSVVPSDLPALTRFGNSLALSGNTVAVAGSSSSDNAVYVFVRSGSAWTQEQRIFLPAGAVPVGAWFPVALSGDTLLIGAPADGTVDTGAGAVYVYERSGGAWTPGQTLIASDAAAGQAFGFSLAVDGDRAVIGANTERAAYVFTQNGGTWAEQEKIVPPSGGATTLPDKFPISLSNDTLLIGASGDSDGGENAGAAYVYAFNRPPTSSNSTVITSEDVAYVCQAADFPFTDEDAGDTLAQVQITSLPAAGTLALNGTPVAVNQVISSADLGAGHMTFAAAANVNGSPYASFQFKVHDGTVYSTSAYTLTVNVTPVNDPPTSSNSTVTTSEDVAYVFPTADFPFTDEDAGDTLSQIQITTLPAAGALTLNGTAVTANQLISAADLGGGLLTFAAAANVNGSPYASFQFKVHDGTVYSVSAYTMTVNVFNTPVCDAAACGPVNAGSSAEGTSVEVTFKNGVSSGGQTTAIASAPTDDSGLCSGVTTTLGFGILSQSCFDIHTTAQFTPPVDICFTVDSNLASVATLSIMHFDTQVNDWVDVTTSRNTGTNTICGGVDSFSWFVLAYDNTKPTFTFNRLKDTLWPPDHKMVKVATVTNVADNTDPSPTVDIRVSSTDVFTGKDKDKDKDGKDKHKQKGEKDGKDGDKHKDEEDDDAEHGGNRHASDWKVKKKGDTWEVWVRAERSGDSTDHIYTITATVTDKAGNQATDSHTVLVPHDKGER